MELKKSLKGEKGEKKEQNKLIITGSVFVQHHILNLANL